MTISGGRIQQTKWIGKCPIYLGSLILIVKEEGRARVIGKSSPIPSSLISAIKNGYQMTYPQKMWITCG